MTGYIFAFVWGVGIGLGLLLGVERGLGVNFPWYTDVAVGALTVRIGMGNSWVG